MPSFFWHGGVGGVPPPTPSLKKIQVGTVSAPHFTTYLNFPLHFKAKGFTFTHMEGETINLLLAAKKRIEEVYLIAEKAYGTSFVRPFINFKLKGARAGIAYPLRNEIKLNKDLLLQNGESFILDTPGHEAAHLLARTLYGPFIRSHGPEWQKVMITIGQEPKRCHAFKVITNHKYVCKCSEYFLSTTRHNRYLKGHSRYHCTKCKSQLNHIII